MADGIDLWLSLVSLLFTIIKDRLAFRSCETLAREAKTSFTNTASLKECFYPLISYYLYVRTYIYKSQVIIQ